MKISIDKTPINKQAARILSKDSNRLNTVEDALKSVWRFLSSSIGLTKVRDALENGNEVVEYRIKIYKKPNLPGFCVRVYYIERQHEFNPIHFTDLL